MGLPLNAAAVDLAEGIRTRRISPVDLVDAHIRRIQHVNPYINALVADRFELAREEARQAEAAVAEGRDLGPLHGLPCSIKEFIAVEGMPHTGGVVARQHVRAKVDSPVAQRLKEAGAIVLGVTNGPEGGMWHETNNRIYGRTNNPWDIDRTCGGSSGGEGAIVAAGGSAFGIGSDVGGSVRYPAAFCGTFAHKPTPRTIPSTGHYPPAVGDEVVPFSVGPVTRSARDLMPLLRVMAGPDGEDPVTVERTLGDPGAIDIEGLDVVMVSKRDRPRASKAVEAGLLRAARALADRGANVREVSIPRMRRALELWLRLITDYDVELAELCGQGGEVALMREIARYPWGRSRHTGPVLIGVAIERLMHVVPNPPSMLDEMRALANDIDIAVGANGVLLHPCFTRTAPRHRAITFNLLDAACTTVFNVSESPVSIVPVGFDRHMPIGIQVAGRRGQDHVCIAAAIALEESLGGWLLAQPRRGSRRLKFVWRTR